MCPTGNIGEIPEQLLRTMNEYLERSALQFAFPACDGLSIILDRPEPKRQIRRKG
jgi:hypothetical protein